MRMRLPVPACPCATCDCWDCDGRHRLAASVPGCPAWPGDLVVVLGEPSHPVRAREECPFGHQRRERRSTNAHSTNGSES